MREYQRCSRCILDTSVSDIFFNEKGVCKYCLIHDEMEKKHPIAVGEDSEAFRAILDKIRQNKKNKYNCIIGVSGGRDSTYCLYLAKKHGLNPLAVHFDNGWNSEISTKNIKSACNILGIELFTYVADWEKFKDLQLAFLKASTSDADIPTDYAIYSLLFQVAKKEKIKYIINGHSFQTEGSTPISWTYMDYRYIKHVYKKFGSFRNLKGIPLMTLADFVWYVLVSGIKEVRILELVEYNRDKATQVLENELEWRYYGGHHHENNFTKFFQSYYLPQKFGIDKRKVEYSALIRTGQISVEDALKKIAEEYPYDDELITYVQKKLSISPDEFATIMRAPVKTHEVYKTYLPLIRLMRGPIKIAVSMRLLPQILYLKYAK
jgi:N-acetyl sugar amidotransferase